MHDIIFVTFRKHSVPKWHFLLFTFILCATFIISNPYPFPVMHAFSNVLLDFHRAFYAWDLLSINTWRTANWYSSSSSANTSKLEMLKRWSPQSQLMSKSLKLFPTINKTTTLYGLAILVTNGSNEKGTHSSKLLNSSFSKLVGYSGMLLHFLMLLLFAYNVALVTSSTKTTLVTMTNMPHF